MTHLLITGSGGSDYTGVVFTLAGVVLLGLALRVGFRGWRWLIQALASLVPLVTWSIGQGPAPEEVRWEPSAASPSTTFVVRRLRELLK